MDVTIIIPTHNPDKELLKGIKEKVLGQKFNGKIKVQIINEMGLAEALNYGIKNSKTKIIVSLHQDCIPSSNDWLSKLVEPFKDKSVVASVSKVELPYEFWKNFSFFAKIFSVKEQKIITPLMDEKGCAYKKSAIEKSGFFDGKTFRTAGEDFDMYLKLRKIGKIAYPNVKVFHYHKHTFKNRLKKEAQLAEASGVLVKKYKTEIKDWDKRILISIPLFGSIFLILKFPFYRMIFGGILFLFFAIVINFIYSYNFWKGFFTEKQII